MSLAPRSVGDEWPPATILKGVSELFGVSGMAHILPVKVRSRVFVAKCSEPQAESREAGVKEAVQQI